MGLMNGKKNLEMTFLENTRRMKNMLAEAALATGVKMMITMTGIGVGSSLATDYLDSKAESDEKGNGGRLKSISSFLKLGTHCTLGFIVLTQVANLLGFLASHFL